MEELLLAISLAIWGMFNIVTIALLAIAGILTCLILVYVLLIIRRINRIMIILEVSCVMAKNDARRIHALARRYLNSLLERVVRR